MSGGIPGALFADFNGQEACQAPQRITQSLAEALPPPTHGLLASPGRLQLLESAQQWKTPSL